MLEGIRLGDNCHMGGLHGTLNNNDNVNSCYTANGLGGIVIHSAVSEKGPEFNSSVARAYFVFKSRSSTLAGKQCWLCAVRLQLTVIVE